MVVRIKDAAANMTSRLETIRSLFVRSVSTQTPRSPGKADSRN
jgi:hypothetical protein